METPWYLDPKATPPEMKFSSAVSRLKKEASELFGVPVREIFTPNLSKPHVNARRYVWANMRAQLNMSLPQIARATGEYDHTTVLYGIRAHTGHEAVEKKRRRCAESYRASRVARIVVEPVRVSEDFTEGRVQ